MKKTIKTTQPESQLNLFNGSSIPTNEKSVTKNEAKIVKLNTNQDLYRRILNRKSY
jgi:hypothetical protein